jgi:hypothetical protein
MPTVSAEEPSLPEYPKNSAAFGRLMRGTGEDQQLRVTSITPRVDDLMSVRDDELVLLTHLPMTIDTSIEMGRRNIAALSRSIEAVRDLGTSLRDLQTVTESANAKSIEALSKLGQSIENLRTATDKWSRWLTRFTIAITGFTLVLVVLGAAQVCR